MEESNPTNLKLNTSNTFFNKRMKTVDVQVLCRDSWRERLRGNSKPLGLKMLRKGLLKVSD
jgi:hypothetical protein